MNPYHVLGIDYDATQDEIKQAYRRLAMKWHPDRNRDSVEAKERFHEAAEAYKTLYERASNRGNGSGDARARDDAWQSYTDSRAAGSSDADDEFAESLFWDVMLDYAIKLAQTGMNEHEITLDICKNGCGEKLARRIADKAYNIHAHYTRDPDAGKRRKAKPDRSTFKEERLDGDLYRAFIGQRSYVLSSRGATDNFLVVFRAFRRAGPGNPLAYLSPNRRLLRILNFSLVLFTVLLLAVYYFPGPSDYKLLPDKQLLQLPFLVLPLMFVWMLYRKLWNATLVLLPVYAATIAWYNAAVPIAVHRDLYALIPVALAGFAPFALIALFGNYLYYRKARTMLRQAKQLFTDHIDQMVWIKNRAGTSSTAAMLFVLLFGASLIHLVPRNWEFSGPVGFAESPDDHAYEAARLEKIKQRTSEARHYFDIAESHYNATPPDFGKAEAAYRAAADSGSLLAAYRLGYMYYTGEGTGRSDRLAFDYFLRATRAPLAFQPHNLELTTRFLGESYNNLGLMYQHGLGTRKNSRRAVEMYQRAAEFGIDSARRNLESLHRPAVDDRWRELVYPDYR